MIIMNCCDYCWEPQPPPAARRLPFAANYFPQTALAPDYVYNPKEARIRKAMRDQANRARAAHQQNQRQQQPLYHHHHHQTNNQQQHSHPIETRNEIINRTRLNSLPQQMSSTNNQSSHKISHLLIPPHVLQHKSSHIQLQQVSHGMFSEGCNQQWMVGLDHRPDPQHPQQNLAQSQHNHDKIKASIRHQVEQGIVDEGYDLMDVDTMTYPNARAVVEVGASGSGDGIGERSDSRNKGGASSQVSISNGQDFTIFTDIDGQQHWYPYIEAEDIKVYNGGSVDNIWNNHQEQQPEQLMHQHHLQHENLHMKMHSEQQQIFPLQSLLGTDTSIQGKADQTEHLRYKRVVAVPSSEMNSSEEESLHGQQYFICSPSMPHPQVKFSIQPKAEAEDTKDIPTERETSQISSADGTLATVKTNNNINHPNQEEIGQRNPDLLPLPDFQQAFGSTEIGRFANEGFLSQVRVSLALPANSHSLPITTPMPNASHEHPSYPSTAAQNYPSAYTSQYRLPQGMVNTFPCTYQHHHQLRPLWECQRDLPIRQ